MKRAPLLLALVAGLAVASAAAPAAPVADKPRKVSFLTRDGKSLAALYRKPAKDHGVVVMLHGLESTKEEWTPFAEALAKQGWGSFIYDARGHGASDKAKKGIRALGAPGEGSEWARMPEDLAGAVRYLETTAGIAKSSVAVMGASLGANVAARYAAESSKLLGLVLLSPGLNYMEFKPEADVVKIKTPTLLVASVDDKYAFSSSLRLKNLAPADDLWTDVPPGHGVQMLNPALTERLLAWLAQR